jgi:hypothetical protein
MTYRFIFIFIQPSSPVVRFDPETVHAGEISWGCISRMDYLALEDVTIRTEDSIAVEYGVQSILDTGGAVML